jgi:hypothetical protein
MPCCRRRHGAAARRRARERRPARRRRRPGCTSARVRLAPGGRYVVQWQWDLHPGPRSLSRGPPPAGAPPARPRRRRGGRGRRGRGRGAGAGGRAGGRAQPRAGRAERRQPRSLPVELRAARGHDDLRAPGRPPARRPGGGPGARRARPAPHQRRGGAAARRRRGAGRPACPRRGALPDAELAEEALDLWTARCRSTTRWTRARSDSSAGSTRGPATRRCWSGPSGRCSSPGCPSPGLGLAATQLCLALLLAGRPVAPVLQHLAALAATADRPPQAGPLVAQTSLLELEVVSTARVVPGDATGSARVRDRVAALGAGWGAGLTGRAVRPVPVDQLAHLCAVLALLPEPAAAAHRTRWGCTAHVLAAARGPRSRAGRLGTGGPRPERRCPGCCSAVAPTEHADRPRRRRRPQSGLLGGGRRGGRMLDT